MEAKEQGLIVPMHQVVIKQEPGVDFIPHIKQELPGVEPVHVKTEPSFQINGNNLEEKARRELERIFLSKEPHEVYSDDNEYICRQCDFTTDSVANLKTHIDTLHTKKIKCDYCKYTTLYKSIMDKHLNSRHLKTEIFRCYFCSYSSTWKDYLKVHIYSKHVKTYTYKCDYCNYSSRRKSNFIKHIKTKHKINTKTKKVINSDNASDDDLYLCKQCDFTTREVLNLKHHINDVHMTKYKCEYCSYTSTNKYYLKKHRKVKHKVS